jgi:hypothetical protein
VVETIELGILWALLAATLLAVLVRPARRVAWPAAGLLAAAWVGIHVDAIAGGAAAAGVLAAAVLEGRPGKAEPDFDTLVRAIAAVGAGLVAAAFLVVRIVHAEVALAEMAYPAVASATVALAVVVLASAGREQARATRLLTALGIAAWAWAAPGEVGTAAVAALALPAMALAGRWARVPPPTPG